MRLSLAIAFAWVVFTPMAVAGPKVGPKRGALIVVGGGAIPDSIASRFIELAGGPQARIVWVPTADDAENPKVDVTTTFLARAGAKNITVLHTRDPNQAGRKEFVEQLKKANAVWFAGGRQWRFVDAYLGTRTEKEFRKVLRRGGVIGGTSAGATIQGSYLVRGARSGNTIMMAPGYEKGFGYLRGVAVDQHLLKRNRQDDLVGVIEKHPGLLGIGLDESTAIEVRGDEFVVIGLSKAAIYHRDIPADANGKRYRLLSPGTRYNMAERSIVGQ